MDSEIVTLQRELSELRTKFAAAEERLRSVETSYHIDKRVIVIVGTALAVVILAFTGFSIYQMPEKIIAKMEDDVRAATGKTLSERVLAADAALADAEQAVSKLNEKSREFELTIGYSYSEPFGESYAAQGIATGPAGSNFRCPPHSFVSGLTVFSNNEGRYAGLKLSCVKLQYSAQ